MIIDFHTHNFPDKIAARAIEGMCIKLEGRIVPYGDGTLGRQVEDMKRDGIDYAVMCPIATKPEQADIILQRALEIREGRYGGDAAKCIIPLASLHPKDTDLDRHIQAIVDAKIPGIKIHPNYQDFTLDDPDVVPFFAALHDAGLFVQSHCGLDLGFLDARMCSGPNEIVKLLKAVPGLKFVAAHLGGTQGNPDYCTDQLLDFENVFIDTATLVQDREKAESIRVIESWPAERILFATDYPWSRQKDLVEWVKLHRPDPEEQEKIFSKNALKLYRGKLSL